MAQLQRIEADVAALPADELRRFRSWFDTFDTKRWDRDLVSDISNGKLDALAAEATAEYNAGKCRPV